MLNKVSEWDDATMIAFCVVLAENGGMHNKPQWSFGLKIAFVGTGGSLGTQFFTAHLVLGIWSSRDVRLAIR